MVWYVEAPEFVKENGGDFMVSAQQGREILMTVYM